MIRKCIVLMIGLTLILAGQLCFADGERGAPKPQISVNPAGYVSGQTNYVAGISQQSEQSYEQAAPIAVSVEPSEQSYEQVAPTAVMVQQSEQSHAQVAPAAIMVQQTEQSHQQVAPVAVMAQQNEQLHQQIAPTAVTVQQSEQSHAQVAPAAIMVQQPGQQHGQIVPTAVMITPSATVAKQGYSTQVTRALPSMNVSVSGIKGMGPKPQSMKAVSAIAVQATQKK